MQIQVRGRAAAEKQGAHRSRRFEPGQFDGQRFEVKIDELILPRSHCEVAVPAMMSAKWDVNVGCMRHRCVKPPRFRDHVVQYNRTLDRLTHGPLAPRNGHGWRVAMPV